MRNLEMSNELRMIKDTITKFCQKEISTVAPILDQSSVFQEKIFRGIFDKLAGLGFLGLLIPEKYGGSGSDFISVALVLEELGKVSPGIAFSYLAHTPVMAYANIYVNGTEHQRKKYLKAMCRGEIIGANAITEPDAGSDLYSIKTTAIEKQDHFIINGSKTFITNARVAKVFYVLAKDKSAEKKLSGFLVDIDSPGIKIGKDLDKCGYRSSPTSEVFFQDCIIPKENLLGERGKGLELSLSEIELQRIYLSFISIGLADAALHESIKYAKERIQFGKPIAEYQLVRSKLADMVTSIEVAKTMNYRAITDYQKTYENGQKSSSLIPLITKKFATTTCVDVVMNAVEIHGAYGFIKEYAVERYFREAKLLDVVAGSNDILRLMIAKRILK